MTTIHRAVVRGHFENLTDDRKAALLAEVDEHDLLRASTFTSDGTFIYDRQLVAFNLRYEIRGAGDGSTDPTAAAEREALERAIRWLADASVDHKHLRVTVTDMASIWND